VSEEGEEIGAKEQEEKMKCLYRNAETESGQF